MKPAAEVLAEALKAVVTDCNHLEGKLKAKVTQLRNDDGDYEDAVYLNDIEKIFSVPARIDAAKALTQTAPLIELEKAVINGVGLMVAKMQKSTGVFNAYDEVIDLVNHHAAYLKAQKEKT